MRRPAYRLPAEFERQDAVWLCWPHNPADWPGKFAPAVYAFAEIVRLIAKTQQVRLIARDHSSRRKIETVLRKTHANLDNVAFFTADTDRGWTRDFMPLFVHDGSGAVTALDFAFNGWAKYDNHRLDAAASGSLARQAGLPVVVPARDGKPVVLEGGAIDVNGCGAILATQECLLDPKTQVRNPGFTQRDYEDVFAAYLGAAKTIWLDSGIAGDDTHGHVDDVCRFVAPDTVVLCREADQNDVNYAILNENRERLADVRLPGLGKIQVVDLPMPRPLHFDRMRLPASYANFLITNDTVLVPTFNDAADRVALGILAELFPARDVVGIHCVDLVWGLGTIHCLSHEQPSPAARGI